MMCTAVCGKYTVMLQILKGHATAVVVASDGGVQEYLQAGVLLVCTLRH